MAIQAGAFIFAAHHNVTQQVYTPVLTATTSDPTLGSGSTAVGEYWRDPISGWVYGHFLITFGTSGVDAGSGMYVVSLPTPAIGFQAGNSIGRSDIWGLWTIRDNSATAGSRQGLLVRFSTSSGPGGVGQVVLSLLDGATTFVTNAAPFTWDASDSIAGTFFYPTTPDV